MISTNFFPNIFKCCLKSQVWSPQPWSLTAVFKCFIYSLAVAHGDCSEKPCLPRKQAHLFNRVDLLEHG